MSVRIFGCRKFLRLSNEAADRELNPREEAFLSRHRDVCEACRSTEVESRMALNMLRNACMEVEVQPHFDERVIRRFRTQSVKESLGYWSPALIGAVVAGVCLMAALSLVSHNGAAPRASLPGGEASRFEPKLHAFPSLELNRVPRFVR